MKDLYRKLKSEPFIMISGEVHNSNSSTAAAMEQAWAKAKELNLNTLLVPVTWELLEPEEGKFDFAQVDMLLAGAREHGLHLVPLWFGTWKNAQCNYAPAWVKMDLDRFKRGEIVKGQPKTSLQNFHNMPYTTLSYLCEETRKADEKAFAMLMKHLKEVDGAQKTVLMVQVENETGLQGSARERSDIADAAFAGQVPVELIAWLKANTADMAPDVKAAVESAPDAGDWATVFGPVAEELFSAYHIASYVDAVAAAGRAEYDLPMAVNCWLDKGQKPGEFPSGGPVARVMEVWQYCAPHIDVFAPDIYVQNFCEVCESYTKRGNPLMIPETATHSHAAPRLIYTVGHHHALGFSPFGFEDMGGTFSDTTAYLFGIDTSDPLLSTPQSVEEYAWCTDTLQKMMPLLTDAYGTNRLQAVISEQPGKDMMLFEKFGFKALMNLPIIERKDGVCLALQTEPDTFYVIANACLVAPFSTDRSKPNVDILALEEGKFVDGQWQVTCRLNGDEAANMSYHKPTLLKIKLFAY